MELLIVIAIIAILAAALIVGINPAGRFRQARNSTRWQHMGTIANAIYAYAVEHGGSFPRTATDTYACIGDGSSTGTPVTIRVCQDEYGTVLATCLDADGTTTISTWCYGTELVVPEYMRIPPEDPMELEYYQVQFVDTNEDAIRITSTAEETWIFDATGTHIGYEIFLVK